MTSDLPSTGETPDQLRAANETLRAEVTRLIREQMAIGLAMGALHIGDESGATVDLVAYAKGLRQRQEPAAPLTERELADLIANAVLDARLPPSVSLLHAEGMRRFAEHILAFARALAQPATTPACSHANSALHRRAPELVHVAWNGNGEPGIMPGPSLDAVTYHKSPLRAPGSVA